MTSSPIFALSKEQGKSMKPPMRSVLSAVFLVSLVMPILRAQVLNDRLLRAAAEPHNWMMYSGTYASQRYSTLSQINPSNVKNLEQKWIFQAESLEKFETTPLVVDGIMYISQAPSDALALDAKTGRVFWIYRYYPSTDARPCCGSVNRGLAILGDTLFLATLDAHLVALDAKTGRPIWNTRVANASAGYAMTVAPLVVKDKVIVGVAGGEFGIRGFIAAYDVRTGREAWRFNTIPGPGEPGHETWQGQADAWEHGGGAIWTTGSYDPALNLTYWGTGNPGPDWNPGQREGDNLYSDSVVALDPDTGKLKWFFQFTPNDPYDYDSTQVPVLVDANWNGSPRKLMMWANRNGFFYVLDRATGQFLAGYPFVKVNWASGLDAKGRPIQTPQPENAPTFPGVQGGTNWYSPSYSPRTGLFYVSAWEDYASVFVKEEQKYQEGQRFVGGRPATPIPGGQNIPSLKRGPINVWTEAAGHGAVVAIDPRTGDKKWRFLMTDVTYSGILTTAADLLFTGGREGYFHALDARTGALLWNASLGGQVASGPMTFEVEGKQYVSVAAGHSLFTFGLRE
ncbi:MAG: PQQ-dependent dehydrogenase, methanol/ethanol family [Acidobacteria bacterium]|nr:MAG: PQQ-dependent dehydrogenase, methanol/ethanol family [Acidobacteriota bacterium]